MKTNNPGASVANKRNDMHSHGLVKGLFLFALLLMASIVKADMSFNELKNQGEIKVRLQQQTKNTVPNQQVVFLLNVMSTHNFSDDFKSSYLDVPDTLIIQAKDKADFLIKEEDGKTWFIQQKKIILYPLQSTRYTLPEIQLKVFIKGDKQVTLSGNLHTTEYSFDINKAKALNSIDDFIASPELSFNLNIVHNQQEVAQLNKTFEIGDAITFSYQLNAKDVHSLMLPHLTFSEINGVKQYKKPSIKRDEFERFEKTNTAMLTEVITLIFQQEGQFELPEQRLSWWDTKSLQLKQAVIEKQIITVGKGAGVDKNSQKLNNKTSASDSLDYFSKLAEITLFQWLYLFISMSFIIAISRQLIRHKKALTASFHQWNQTQLKQLKKRFNQQLTEHDYQGAITTLYQVANLAEDSVLALSTLIAKDEVEVLKSLTALQTLAFNQDKTTVTTFNTEDAHQLFNTLEKQRIELKKKHTFHFSKRLNP